MSALHSSCLQTIIATATISFASCTAAFAADLPPVWNYSAHPSPQLCKKAKAGLSQLPTAFLTFKPMPKPSVNVASVWRFRWHGLDIPIPVAHYDQITLLNNDRTLAFGLGFGKTQGVLFVYLRNNERRISKSNPSAGKLSDKLAYRGFTITPEDLECSEGNVKQNVLNALALKQKTTTLLSTPHVISVYRMKSPENGILVYSYGRTSKLSSVYSYQWMKWPGPKMYQLRYNFSNDEPYLLEAGLLFAQNKNVSYTASPIWLQRIQTWLDKPNHTHWCKLLAALKQADFNTKNIKDLASQHPACHT